MRSTLLRVMVLLMPLLYACGQNQSDEDKSRDELSTEIRQLEKQLATTEADTLDLETARTLIAKSSAFARKFYQDSLAPVFLFRAADVARGIGEYPRAIKLWKEVYTRYEDFEKAPEALFLVAFTYDKDLQKETLAIDNYNAFRQRFPDHHLVKDAELLLAYLQSGKTPEELIKEFKKQNQQ